jgi:chitin disaccharide deacetylase
MVLTSESSAAAPGGPGEALAAGSLIINADDWGRSRDTTDRTLECCERGSISSVSAMVFMEDSERAAALARERGIDAGLHLNFTTPFSGEKYPAMLREHQQRIARRLRRHRFAPALFYPDLISSFNYVVSAQFDEFARLYGGKPQRLDGHHHMHLCSNVVLGRLLQAGTVIRRNFSFEPGEKSFANRLYRRTVDRFLSRRHLLTDFFFSLTPLAPKERLNRIFSLSRRFVVEVETHPLNPEEHRFLAGGRIFRQISGCGIASCFTAGTNGNR